MDNREGRTELAKSLDVLSAALEIVLNNANDLRDHLRPLMRPERSDASTEDVAERQPEKEHSEIVTFVYDLVDSADCVSAVLLDIMTRLEA